MPDIALINGNAVSWNSLRWNVFLADGSGGRFFGFHSLDFGGEKRERPGVSGQNKAGAPLMLPEGKYTPPNPKIGWLAHAADANSFAPYESFTQMLARGAPDGVSYGDTVMYWQLQVISQVATILYEWFNVVVTEPGGSWEEGAEGLKLEMGFTCLRFKRNGNTLYNSSEE